MAFKKEMERGFVRQIVDTISHLALSSTMIALLLPRVHVNDIFSNSPIMAYNHCSLNSTRKGLDKAAASNETSKDSYTTAINQVQLLEPHTARKLV